MTNNDILRRLRFAFDFSDKQAIALFKADPSNTREISSKQWEAYLHKQEDAGHQACPDRDLAAFLDGFIADKRGLREPTPPAQELPEDYRLSRNDILKKLRIALNFREEDMLATLEAGGTTLSKSELGAFFRKPGHKHFRACGNQVLRNFIVGITKSNRDI